MAYYGAVAKGTSKGMFEGLGSASEPSPSSSFPSPSPSLGDEYAKEPKYGVVMNRKRHPKEHQYRLFAQLLSMMNDPEFMDRCPGALLHADMGTGKSLVSSTLPFLMKLCTRLFEGHCYPNRSNRHGFRCLIIAPCKLVSQWAKELVFYFGPGTKVLPIDIGQIPPRDWKDMRDNITEGVFDRFDYVVMSYSSVALMAKNYRATAGMRPKDSKHAFTVPPLAEGWHRDLPYLKGMSRIFRLLWDLVIFDEAEFVVNPTSKTWEAMMALHARFKIALSGTPWRNEPSDVYALMRVIGAQKLTTLAGWSLEKYRALGLPAHKISMSKKDAGLVLPRVHRVVRIVKLTSREREFYELLEDIRANKPVMEGQPVALDLRKRQVCIAPTLTVMIQDNAADPASRIRERAREQDGKGGDDDPDAKEGPPEDELSEKTEGKATFAKFASPDQNRVLESMLPWLQDFKGEAGIYSSKNNAVVDEIQKIPPGEKCLVFTNFDKALQLLELRLTIEGFGSATRRFSSALNGRKLQAMIDEFNEKPDVRILLISYGCGARGLNLTVANHTIKMDPWYCPGVDDQSFCRVYRMGQERECYDVHLHSGDTIEERMVEIGQEKKVDEDEWLEQERARECAYHSVLEKVKDHKEATLHEKLEQASRAAAAAEAEAAAIRGDGGGAGGDVGGDEDPNVLVDRMASLVVGLPPQTESEAKAEMERRKRRSGARIPPPPRPVLLHGDPRLAPPLPPPGAPPRPVFPREAEPGPAFLPVFSAISSGAGAATPFPSPSLRSPSAPTFGGWSSSSSSTGSPWTGTGTRTGTGTGTVGRSPWGGAPSPTPNPNPNPTPARPPQTVPWSPGGPGGPTGETADAAPAAHTEHLVVSARHSEAEAAATASSAGPPGGPPTGLVLVPLSVSWPASSDSGTHPSTLFSSGHPWRVPTLDPNVSFFS
jgi:hypothetical protein